MDSTTLQNALTLLAGRKWLPLFVILIGWATRLLSDKSRFAAGSPLANIPSRWQPVLVLGLATVYSAVTAVQSGATWRDAAVHAVVVACVTMGAYDVVTHALFPKGAPRWIAWLTLTIPREEPKEPRDPQS